LSIGSPRLVLAKAGIKHPWTNRQIERMNRTIKEATVKRYHYESHRQLEAYLQDFIYAYNYGRRLKTLKGLTLFEYICKIWTIQPDQNCPPPLPVRKRGMSVSRGF
jgi:Integrase core domain